MTSEHAGASAERFDLARFVQAQDAGDSYRRALTELRRGRKSSHWMWFVFPQLAGLGRSETARRYAISGIDEARAYLDHPILGPRLCECAAALLAQPSRDASHVLGPVDAQKLHSSMTLFARVAGEAAFARVLDEFFDRQTDAATERLLAGAPPESGRGYPEPPGVTR